MSLLSQYLETVRTSSDPLVSLLDLKGEAVLSLLCFESKVEDPFLYRCQRRARLLAATLLNEKGELRIQAAAEIVDQWKERRYFFFPNSPDESHWSKHVFGVLSLLAQDTGLSRQLLRFRLPLCHLRIEHLVRAVLEIPRNEPLTEALLRQAVLSSCFTLLRQSIGSCFATAPAIKIHQENLRQYLVDLEEILMTGRLSRTFGGVQYVAPLSLNTGWGNLKRDLLEGGSLAKVDRSPSLNRAVAIALKMAHLPKSVEQGCRTMEDVIRKITKGKKPEIEEEISEIFKAGTFHPLLKIWEYTLASFSSLKMEFSKWNLYASLGLDPREKGGLGVIIHDYIDEKLKQANLEYEKTQEVSERAFHEMKHIEHLAKNSGEAELRRVQAQYQASAHHFYACLDLRDRNYKRAIHYSQFFSFLMKIYDEKFHEFFQEIYDAKIESPLETPYDDSPAGFRLVYKHRRSDTAAWTPVSDAKEWERVLTDFFLSIEPDIISRCEFEGANQDLFEITSRLIQHLRSHEFLLGAMNRCRKNIHPHATPWAYVSGGTMETLVNYYFRHEYPITKEEKRIESPLELSVFLLDVLKAISFSFQKEDGRSLLMHSPTHAFLLYPGWDRFFEGWQNDQFSYTWIRDTVVLPAKNFYDEYRLSKEEQEFLVTRMKKLWKSPFPLSFRYSYFPLSIESFAEEVLSYFQLPNSDLIASFLYENLPLYSIKRAEECATELFGEKISFQEEEEGYWSAKQICEIVWTALLRREESCRFASDPYVWVIDQARKKGIFPFFPMLFADTNWPHFFFAFIVNPTNGKFELWRTDRAGLTGVPMSSWKPWLDGSHNLPWTVYTRST